MIPDTFGKSVINKYKNERTQNINFKRLLSKHELKRELKQPSTTGSLPHTIRNRNVKDDVEDLSTFRNLKRGVSNDFDTYMKSYKSRNSKKKGLAKLDCYCENKVFNKLEYLSDHAKGMKNDKSSFKKKVFNKYGIRNILFFLPFLLGTIYPMLFLDKKQVIKICDTICSKHDDKPENAEHVATHYISPFKKETWDIIEKMHPAFYYIFGIIVLSVIIYSFIKVRKYEKLKTGKR